MEAGGRTVLSSLWPWVTPLEKLPLPHTPLRDTDNHPQPLQRPHPPPPPNPVVSSHSRRRLPGPSPLALDQRL